MARIALVQPLKYSDYTEHAGVAGLYEGVLAFGFLSHFLKSKGHEVIVSDINLHEDYLGRLIEFAPEFAGVRFEGYECETVARAIKKLKQYEPGVKTVLGGPATMLYRDRAGDILKKTAADYVVFGDGIPALHDIAAGQADSPGVAYVKGDYLERIGRADSP